MNKRVYEEPKVEIEEFKLAEHIAKCEQPIGGFYMNTCSNDRNPVEDNNTGYTIFNSAIENSGCEKLPEELFCYNSTDSNISIFGS